MIVTGLLILGFVAYELWGTGLHTQQAQDDLESAYFERLERLQLEAESSGKPGATTTSASGDDGDSATSTTGAPESSEPLDPFLDPAVLEKLAELPPPEGGEPIGRIEIPVLGVEWWVVEGTDLSYLRDGPGHFLGTPMPGQPGNAALAGHRTTYGAPFHNLDRLKAGDEILVSTFQGKFKYEVMAIPVVDGQALWRPPQPPEADDASQAQDAETEPSLPPPAPSGDIDPGATTTTTALLPEAALVDPDEVDEWASHFIVNPDDREILHNYGDDRLTLMACNPKYSARQRIIVSAKLIGPAAPPTPINQPEEPTEVLPGDDLPDEPLPDLIQGGDPAARTPMIIWGLITAAIAVPARVLGRRWHGWARFGVYVFAAPFFAGALWSFYANLDAMLPAAL